MVQIWYAVKVKVNRARICAGNILCKWKKRGIRGKKRMAGKTASDTRVLSNPSGRIFRDGALNEGLSLSLSLSLSRYICRALNTSGAARARGWRTRRIEGNPFGEWTGDHRDVYARGERAGVYLQASACTRTFHSLSLVPMQLPSLLRPSLVCVVRETAECPCDATLTTHQFTANGHQYW